MKSNIIKTVLKNFLRIIFSYFAWMRKYASNPGKYPIKEKYRKLHLLCVKIFKDLGGEVRVVGLENLPQEASCLTSNHIGAADPLIILLVLKDHPTTFVCKKEIKNYPFVAKCVYSIEGEFIDRQDLKASLKTMMKVQADLKIGDKNWLIFPEGTRNKDDHALLLDFHHGTFRSAMKANVPIVPVCIYGTQRLLTKKYKFKKYPIYLEFGKPLYPKDYEGLDSKEVALIVKSRVQTMLSYHARSSDKNELVKLLGDKYQENY